MKARFLYIAPGPGERTYPYLGIMDGGTVVLFSQPATGMVVAQGKGTNAPLLGYCAAIWDEGAFRRAEGVVKLSNQDSAIYDETT